MFNASLQTNRITQIDRKNVKITKKTSAINIYIFSRVLLVFLVFRVRESSYVESIQSRQRVLLM